jgi:hypothetical protein
MEGNRMKKGYDSFRILSPNEVAYLDFTGSGNETSAHVAENARITFMFVAFSGPPQILRLYGTGSVVLPGTPRWEPLIGQFENVNMTGARQLICATVTKVKTSCGFSVPYFEYSGERDALLRRAISKGEQGLDAYRQEKNAVSMDGIVTPLGK